MVQDADIARGYIGAATDTSSVAAHSAGGVRQAMFDVTTTPPEDGDTFVYDAESGKFVPKPPNPEITFTLSPGVIGDTSTHNYPVLLDGSGDPTVVGMVGAWTNDENGNLVPPEDGVYEAVFEIAGVQSVAGAIALETSINSGSSAYAISAVNPYIPAVPSGGAARPVTTTAWNYTDPPVVGPDRSLGGLRIKHLEAASDGADVTFFVRIRKISDVLP
jgi:hypothetical protein